MSDAEARYAVNALGWAQNGILAAPGGWGNQTQHGASLLSLAAAERARIERSTSEQTE